MLDKARAYLSQSLKESSTTKFQFIQGRAEDLSQTTLQPESVDLVIAGIYDPPGLLNRNHFLKQFSLSKSISASCSLVRLEQSLATSTSYTTSRRNCCLLGIIFTFESNLLKYLSFFKGLYRISTHKSPYFDTFDHGILSRKRCTHKHRSTFPTTWKNHVRTPPCRCSGTFIDLKRWWIREVTSSLLLR